MKYLSVTTLCLAALFVRAEFIDTGDAVGMRNSRVEVTFDKKTLSLRQLRDLARKVNYVVKPGGSLFNAIFGIYSADNWRTVNDYTLNGLNMPERNFRMSRGSNCDILELHYNGGIVGDQGKTADIHVTVTLPDGNPFISWHIAVDNHSGTPLKEVQFPLLSGLGSDAPGSAENDSVALPLFCGSICRNPRKTLVAGQEVSNYPMSSGLSFQMMYYDDSCGGGLYFAAYDTDDYHKTFACRPEGESFRMFNIHYAETMPERAVMNYREPFDSTTPFGVWKLPYPVVTGTIHGDWYDAAKVYRRWSLKQERWKPLAERRDVAERFRSEVLAWLSVWGRPDHPIQALVDGRPNTDPKFITDCRTAMDRLADKVIGMQNELGVKLGVHLYMWYKSGEMDLRYPDYFPALPGVREGIAKIRAAGGAVMPYVNVLLFDASTPQYAQGKPCFKMNSSGEITATGPWGHSLYHSFGGWGSMCFATEWWQNYITEVYRQLKDDYNCDAEYMDLLFSSQSFCFDKRHGHTIPGGNYFGKGGRALTARVKALRPAGRSYIVGENVGETYIGTVDGQLVALPENDPTTPAMFDSVYSDRTNLLGVYQCSDAHLCFMLARGRVFYLSGDAMKAKAPNMTTLRNMLHTRRAALEFLHDGELLRQPDLSGIEHVRDKWWVVLKNAEVEYSIPVVFTEVYRSPAGAIGLVFANHTDREQTVTFPWNVRDWGYPVGLQVKRSECIGGKWGKAVDYVIGEKFSVTIPPKNAAVIKLAGDKPSNPISGAEEPVATAAGTVSLDNRDDGRFNPDNPMYWGGK